MAFSFNWKHDWEETKEVWNNKFNVSKREFSNICTRQGMIEDFEIYGNYICIIVNWSVKIRIASDFFRAFGQISKAKI